MSTEEASWAPRARRVGAFAVVIAGVAGLSLSGGCGSKDRSSETQSGGSQAEAPASVGERLAAPPGQRSIERTLGGPMGIVVDGSFDEWSGRVPMTADHSYLYLRMDAGETLNLQAADETLVIQLDADDDASTGLSSGGLGVDLEVLFSPPSEEAGEGPEKGVRARAFGPSGEATVLPHAYLDLMSAPTFASRTFEIRLSRRVAASGVMPEQGLLTSGRVAARYRVLDADGALAGETPVFRADVPPSSAVPALSRTPIPQAPAGTVRVMSYNVLRSAPASNPMPFVRVIRALEPDVILLQEWDTGEDEIRAWFNDNGYFDDEWDVVTTEAWGVAVASRLPLSQIGTDELALPDDRPGRFVRYAAARVESPVGPIAVASIHLKCCGSIGSSEDLRRIDEALAIRSEFGSTTGDTAMRVIGGDFNLVGSMTPLTELIQGLDTDGSALSVVETFAHGDNAQYTWTDAASAFPPGRLDYLTVSDASAEIVNSFSLDTSRLAPEALSGSRLSRADTVSSDHLPLVVDVRPVLPGN